VVEQIWRGEYCRSDCSPRRVFGVCDFLLFWGHVLSAYNVEMDFGFLASLLTTWGWQTSWTRD